jgi:hypothetical protein
MPMHTIPLPMHAIQGNVKALHAISIVIANAYHTIPYHFQCIPYDAYNGIHFLAIVWYALALAMAIEMVWYLLEIAMVCIGNGNGMN